MSQFYEAFFSDARERLSETELLLLSIKVPHIEHEKMNAIFRAIHSIKGSTATFGFRQATSLTHEFENILDSLRDHKTINYKLEKQHIDSLLSVNDELIQYLDIYEAGQVPETNRTNEVIRQLQNSFNSLFETSQPDHLKNESADLDKQFEKIIYKYKIELIKKNDKDIASLADSLILIGEVSIHQSFEGREILELISTEKISTIKSICLFIVDLRDLVISVTTVQPIETNSIKETNATTSKSIDENTYVAPGHINQALPTSIRVNIQKINALNQLALKLTACHQDISNQLSNASPENKESIETYLSEQSINIKKINDVVSSIRLISLDLIFSRFPRMVRELAAQLNKKAILITDSSKIELDPFLIEHLMDPITHLLRNCLDHGIELPEKRLSGGKQEVGQLKLSAKKDNEIIYIEISDDGIGLNRERIIEKAHEKGIEFAKNISDQQAWELIFEPGFTTAMSVTEISGRGVGMDIVKRNVSELGGKIRIDSVPNQGTIFTISVPMTINKICLSPGDNKITHA